MEDENWEKAVQIFGLLLLLSVSCYSIYISSTALWETIQETS